MLLLLLLLLRSLPHCHGFLCAIGNQSWALTALKPGTQPVLYELMSPEANPSDKINPNDFNLVTGGATSGTSGISTKVLYFTEKTVTSTILR